MKRFKTILGLTMILAMGISNLSIYGMTDGEKLKELDLLTGDASGNLNESQALNRGELATLLCRLNKKDEEARNFSEDMGFTDVADGAWYKGYVNYSKKQGWLNGVGDNKFDPAGIVTQEMVTTVLLRVLGQNPIWGEATSTAYRYLPGIYAKNPEVITRGEVFRYLYSALGVVVEGSGMTLGESIGIESIDELYEIYAIEVDRSTNVYTYYDNEDNVTTAEALGVEVHGVNLSYDGVQMDVDGSYLVVKDGVITHEGYKWSNYYNVYELNVDFFEKERMLVGEDGAYILLDEEFSVVGSGTIAMIEGLVYQSSTRNYVVFDYMLKEEINEYQVSSSVLTDLEGNILYDEGTFNDLIENGTDDDFYITSIRVDNSSFVKVALYHYVDEYPMIWQGIIGIDQVEKASMIDYNLSGRVLDSNHVLLTYQPSYVVYEMVDLVTGESVMVEDEWLNNELVEGGTSSRYVSLNWNEFDSKGILVKSIIVLKDGLFEEVERVCQLVDFDFNVIREYHYEEVSILSDEYLKFTVDGLNGIMDYEENVLIDAQYEVIYAYEDSFLGLIDGVYVKYDLDFNEISRVDNKTPRLVSTFSSGNQLMYSSFTGFSLKDELGMDLIDPDGGVLSFIYRLDMVFLNKGNEFFLYNTDGEQIGDFAGYSSVYYLNMGLFVGTKDDMRYVINSKGEEVYGPFEMEHHLYVIY